ncbi:hypothetical protein [Streptomyces sp. NPDC101776]|uniref:hypothetical protein n=1 Tax=Streptomyces sp. NPDC101776 TaxID=3366146 RepID=UPI0037FE6888
MRCYIGRTGDGFELDPERILALDFGEHRFAVPLDSDNSRGPESAHPIRVGEDGRTSPRGGFRIW